jgi:hypothetical protein
MHVAKAEVGAIGFRVKSGWAAAILLAGPADAPRVVDRAIVELSDEAFPESKQPYHAATGREETHRAKINERVRIVKRAAQRSVPRLVERYRRSVGKLQGAGLIVGSTVEPESIANPHIRAHACEGKLFRGVLVDALAKDGLASRVIVEREAFAEAATVLKRSEARLKQTLEAMGRPVGRPWSANEKLAALAAWIALADARRK